MASNIKEDWKLLYNTIKNIGKGNTETNLALIQIKEKSYNIDYETQEKKFDNKIKVAVKNTNNKNAIILPLFGRLFLETIKEEYSYAILNITREEIIKIAKEVNEEYVIFNDELVEVSTGKTIKKYDFSKTLFSSSSTKQANYSILRSNNPDYSFSLVFASWCAVFNYWKTMWRWFIV